MQVLPPGISYNFAMLSLDELKQAIAATGDKDAIQELIRRGRLFRKELLLEYSYLDGKPISLVKAAEKYSINDAVLRQAVRQKRITRLKPGRPGPNGAAILVEKDIAILDRLLSWSPMPGSWVLRYIYAGSSTN